MRFLILIIVCTVSLALAQNLKTCTEDQICVKNYICVNGKVSTDGRGIIAPRVNVDCNIDEFKVCCLRPGATEKEPPGKFINVDNKINECGYLKKELSGRLGGVSGFQKYVPGLTSRVGGGDEVSSGQFPWNVALLRETVLVGEPIKVYFCGGTIIHPRVVVTAAHCLYKRNEANMIVRAGQIDFKNEEQGHEDRKISKVVLHEKYDNENLWNDIAVIFLTEDFPMNDVIGFVCVPEQNLQHAGKSCIVSGFGKRDAAGKTPNDLMASKLKIHRQDTCNKMFRDTRLGEYFELNKSFICAGGEAGVDACEGDGGSPLVCQIEEYPDRYSLTGIVAWGIDCGEQDVPGAYVNVANFRDWIDNRLFDEFLIPVHDMKEQTPST